MSEWTCNDGHLLRGTFERIEAIAFATPSRREGPRSRVEPDYHGESEVIWESQETVRHRGQDLWVCSNGDLHRACELVEGEPE